MQGRFRGFGKRVAGEFLKLVEVDLNSCVLGESGILEDLPAGALRLGVPRELGEDGAAREEPGEDLRRDGAVDRTGDAPRVAADDALEAGLDDAGRVAAEVRRVGLAGLDASDADDRRLRLRRSSTAQTTVGMRKMEEWKGGGVWDWRRRLMGMRQSSDGHEKEI